MNANKLTLDKKFIIDLIFDKKKITNKDIKKLNLEKIIKESSSNLLLPTVYRKLKSKNLLRYFPVEFTSYIKEIYTINSNRNKQLIKEIHELSELLSTNNINHCFVKGSAMLISNFVDAGERMIGDIDFLYNRQDSEKLKKILLSSGYEKVKGYEIFFNHRHQPRMKKKESLFAIEPHTYMIDRNMYLDTEIMLNQSIMKNSIRVTNTKNTLQVIIYANQINDKGFKYINYNLRSLYDFYSTLKNSGESELIFDKNYITNSYLYVLGKVVGKNYYNRKLKLSVLNRLLLKIDEFKKIKKIYIFFVWFFDRMCVLPRQLRKFLISNNYRNYLLRKIFKQIF